METSIDATAVAASAAASRNTDSSQGTPGFDGSQSKTLAPKIHWWTGRNTALPAGIVKVRVTESPRLPPRNQTGPLWPTPANSPVLSFAQGLVAMGMLIAHCQ